MGAAAHAGTLIPQEVVGGPPGTVVGGIATDPPAPDTVGADVVSGAATVVSMAVTVVELSMLEPLVFTVVSTELEPPPPEFEPPFC